jgi:hypothetical protein
MDAFLRLIYGPRRMSRPDPQRRAVYRYPLRFTRSQLAVASNLMAATGIPRLSVLVHHALAKMAKTELGPAHAPAQPTNELKPTGSDPETRGGF